MTARHIQLPTLPREIIQDIVDNVDFIGNIYHWKDAPELTQQWCRDNICSDMYWGIQIITGDLPAHKDIGTEVKFNYIIHSGGETVLTNFYDNSGNLIETINFVSNAWYIMNVSIEHSVVGVESTRVSLTGRIFPTHRV
jgi:hypothetical protein